MARIILHLDDRTIPFELTDAPFDISRSEKADLRLDKNDVSRKHAVVFREGGVWKLKDPESKGGTFVNGKKVLHKRPVILKHGDKIKIASITLTFENEAELSPGHQKKALPCLEFTDDSPSSIEESISSSGFGSVSVRPEQKLDGILKINAALAGNVDFRAICPRVLDTLFDIFAQADRGAILFLQADSVEPIPVAQRHRDSDNSDSVKISRVILKDVLRTNSAFVSVNTLDDSRIKDIDSIVAQTIHSTMCAPMKGLDGKPFGVINLDSLNPRHRFSQDDLQLLVAVANQASHAYENARLLTFSVTEKVKQEKRDEEMKISAQVQKKLIPAALPQPPGYQFYGSYDAAEAVGGDYFDCFEMPNGKICISFGDVAGKGVPAALIMSRLSGIVRSTMNYTDDVGLAMSQINSLMWSNMVEGRFVTYLLGVIDPAAHTLTFANAGHMPPEVRNRTGDLTNPGTADSGYPIGFFEISSYATSTIQLAAGTSVILRTDGVDEAMSASEEFYGIQRFRGILGSQLANPEAIGRALLTDVKAFMAGRKQHDDIAIMSFGRLPDI